MGGRKTAGSFLFLFGCPKRKEYNHVRENEQETNKKGYLSIALWE